MKKLFTLLGIFGLGGLMYGSTTQVFELGRLDPYTWGMLAMLVGPFGVLMTFALAGAFVTALFEKTK